MVEENVEELVTAVEKAIRKHRKKIWEKQFVQKRIAEIVMDLYRMTAVISRVTQLIEAQGEDKTQTELTIAQVFCQEATRQIGRNFRNMDKNIDEHLKDLSARACQAGGYPCSFF